MRLSEAIALGRVLVRPAARAEYHHDESGCARGMALEAVGARVHNLSVCNFEVFERLWPWTTKTLALWPCSCESDGTRWSISVWITHFFDEHVMQFCGDRKIELWTMERLIDWVASVEPADVPTPTDALASSEASVEVCQAKEE
jgi:hypothetical protein